MSKNLEFATNIDLKGNEIKNVVIDVVESKPTEGGSPGQIKSFEGTLYVAGANGTYVALGKAESAEAVADRVGELESWRTTAESQIANNASANSTNASAISGLQTKMTAAEGKITAAEGKITTLEADNTQNKTDIVALKAAVGDDAEGLASKVAQNTADIKLKANSADVYSKGEVYTKGEVDTEISKLNVTQYAKASDVADTFALYYKKTETYSAGEVDTKISTAVASAYKVKGSSAFESLPANAVVGDVYNVTNSFTLDGKTYPAGTNVVYTTDGWDALAGMVDLSGYVQTSTLNTAVDTLNQSIATKVAKSDYESKMDAIDADLALKAVKTDVDAALALKASTEYVGGEVDRLEGEISKRATKVTQDGGTFIKVTVNTEGIVTSGAGLEAGDIPKITSEKVSDFETAVKAVRYKEDFTAGTSQEVVHNLGVEFPHVTVYNTTNKNIIYADVTYNNESKITISGNVALGAITVIVSP